LNWFFALLLVLSVFSVFIKPEYISVLALIGLLFPFLILINLFFLILRIWQKKRHFIISLIAVLMSFFRITDFYAFNTSDSEVTDADALKVMSYNVRLFDLYKWSGNTEGGEKIFEIIQEEDADIICLQEFYTGKDNIYKNKIVNSQGTINYFISAEDKSGYAGNAVFSRYPIIFSGWVDIGTTTQKCIFTDIVINIDTIRVYSIHLASVGLSRNDYDFLKNLNDNNQKDNIQGVKGIGSKLIQAFKLRSLEVDRIAPHIKSSPYKTIVCGDFNDTPVSYSYRRIRGELNDAFTDAGFGIGNTYAKGIPLFRIDYILHNLKTVSYKRVEKGWSDHYAVTALLEY
jgi:endonuclease/exonuclease/phosphatase family metal-dependent hydrolase